MKVSTLRALSPADGRYADKVSKLSDYGYGSGAPELIQGADYDAKVCP